MIFFGIINIPLFKFFCDLPSSSLLFDMRENEFFVKFYFFDNTHTDLVYFFNNNYFFIDFFFYYSSYIFFFFYISFFNCFFLDHFFATSYDYIEVLSQTSSTNFNFIEFCTLQKFIYIIPNETHLVFFRMYNSISFDISGISIYLIYPTEYLAYFNKIQCFCFEELLLYPHESIDLPVIFFISNEIFNYVEFYFTNKLHLSYLFLVR